MSQGGNLIFRVTDINAIYSNMFVCVCLFVCRPGSFVYLPLTSLLTLSVSLSGLSSSVCLPVCIWENTLKLPGQKLLTFRGGGAGMVVRLVWACLEGVLEIN